MDDYKKKYEDALERAKNLHKDAIDMGENLRAKQCEIIFPELAESEDEKIRKLLIRLFSSNTNEKFDDVSTQEIIAWLEKQGEQKSIIDIDKMVDEFAHAEINGYGRPAMIEVDAYRKGVNDALCLSLNLEKQSEKKSQRMISAEAKEAIFNKPSWSEEDDIYLRDAIYAVENIYTDKCGKEELVHWLKSLKERMKGG